MYVQTLSKTDTAGVCWAAYIASLAPFATQKYVKALSSYWRIYISPEISGIPVGSLRLGDLQAVVMAGYAAGLSAKSLQLLRGTLSGWLRFCRSYELTALRCDDLRIPRTAPHGTRRILSAVQLRALLSAEPGALPSGLAWWLFACQFLAITGLRPGELIGLKWSDLKRDILRIQRSINVEGIVTPGKTAAAARVLPLCPEQLSILKAQRRLLMAAGCPSSFIFPAPDGSPVREQRLFRAWQRLQRALDLPGISLYELRHTFISQCKDLPLSALKMYVGHTASMRTEVYIHETERDLSIMAPVSDRVQALVSGQL